MTPRLRREDRVCQACGAPCPLTSAPDPCLGMLPGTRNACCGHGNRRACMIQLYADYVSAELEDVVSTGGGYDVSQVPDGTIVVALRGERARAIQIYLGGNPAPLTDEPLRGSGYLDGWPFKEE